ncbi:DUF4394 domain-containing protein [Muricoccus aerilatus]|uniref:DUF4394 domain-containing protein n=1 Tax=Muricoccus aerilatus TaxID=452982 RepID=UPI00069408EC|nr:DUF4394 domain-containing protein [Roseomonas aerilata]
MHPSRLTRSVRAPSFRHALTLGSFLVLTATGSAATAAPIIGLAGSNTLIGFDSAAPSAVTSTLSISGLNGEAIRGIDVRPSNGQLYAIGQSGGLFTIDTASGAATRVAGPGIPVNSGNLDFGMAFNPVPDAIRVVTATDQNLRVNPTTGATTIDGTLAYAPADANAGANPNMTAVAYTNQVPGTVTATMLYGIDAATGSLVLQNPPNNGTLSTIGSLGLSFSSSGIGFDIDGLSGQALASLTSLTGGTGLYTINLATGAATFLGGFGSNAVSDIAFGSIGPVAVPEPASMALFGLGLLGLAMVRKRRSGASAA